MRKTRSQTQAENGSSAANLSRSTRTTKTSSRSRDRDTDNDKADDVPSTNPTPPPSSTLSAANQLKRQAPELDSSKLKEYQDMIQVLRVVDLQKVLQFVNQSVAGRKHELQQRVLDLLKLNFELISAKLREIYRTDYYSDRNIPYGPPDPKRMFSQMQMPAVQSTADVRSAMVNMGNVGAGGVGQPTGNGGAVVPGTMGVPFQHAIASMPIHPDVRLKKLAFYDVLATLIKPSSLLPRTNQRIQELPFYFTLTPQQATEIATNRDIRNGSKVEHSIQVQLRFCLLETSCEQEDCFPSNVIVKVNNKLCPLPNPIPTNRPNVEPKRPPRPVNVTSNVKLSPTVTNTVTVQWCPDFSRGYCIAAYLVKKLTSSQLLHRMKTKGIKPADYTRGLIKEKLTEDADCEIATTMLKVSLNCPLGKMKMSIPCRASTCSHLQCFDANLYLQMNERKPTWNCPVCDKPAIYDNLVIDGYFQEVLASSLLGSEDTEIQLHKDGSWSTHNLRNEAQLLDTSNKAVEKVELISDDVELITDDVKPVTTKAPPPPAISNEPTSTTNSETVDLTISDSDDDMPLAKRKTASSKTASVSSAAASTSNGQRSGGATTQSSHKGASEEESSLNEVHVQSTTSNCDIANKIRHYLKTSYTNSINSIDQNVPSHTAQQLNQQSITSSTNTIDSSFDTHDSNNEREEANSTIDSSIAVNYYNKNNEAMEINYNNVMDLNFEVEKASDPKTSNQNSRKRQHTSRHGFNVVPFPRILETVLGPDQNKSELEKHQIDNLRKKWAIENSLNLPRRSSSASKKPVKKPNCTVTSKEADSFNRISENYCPPPSTRTETEDISFSEIESQQTPCPNTSPMTNNNNNANNTYEQQIRQIGKFLSKRENHLSTCNYIDNENAKFPDFDMEKLSMFASANIESLLSKRSKTERKRLKYRQCLVRRLLQRHRKNSKKNRNSFMRNRTQIESQNTLNSNRSSIISTNDVVPHNSNNLVPLMNIQIPPILEQQVNETSGSTISNTNKNGSLQFPQNNAPVFDIVYDILRQVRKICKHLSKPIINESILKYLKKKGNSFPEVTMEDLLLFSTVNLEMLPVSCMLERKKLKQKQKLVQNLLRRHKKLQTFSERFRPSLSTDVENGVDDTVPQEINNLERERPPVRLEEQ